MRSSLLIVTELTQRLIFIQLLVLLTLYIFGRKLSSWHFSTSFSSGLPFFGSVAKNK